MKHTLLLALCAICLALVPQTMGCDSGSGSDNPSGNGGSDGGGLNNDGSGGTDSLLTGMVSATAPMDLSGQPFKGDFYYGGTLTCQNANTCEASVTGSITIEFKCPNHFFLAKTATGSAKFATNVTWDKPGDWGLAPKGTYRDEDGQDHAVKTVVEVVDGQHRILLYEDEGIIGVVDGNKFAWISPGGTKYSGTITDDLKTIPYQTTKPTGKKFDRTLTLVE